MEERMECPLCMEPLDLDDINFFPCACGYQICQFCWHRIRTDENGLCPACRKLYPEDPVQFKPPADAKVQKVKNEKRQKETQRKQKTAESRKHLAGVRVLQKNLVFVVGLSHRLAEADVLKKQDYFGKFGKILKVVVNQCTTYAGSQGPSASAYITYARPEDALRAINAVSNIHIDGRTIKTSLGTTKYCSQFLRGSQCLKTDCMYLHKPGDPAASFTKEQMQQGKHQEYEKNLLLEFCNKQNSSHTSDSRQKTGATQTQQSGRQKRSQKNNTDRSPRRSHAGQKNSKAPTSKSREECKVSSKAVYTQSSVDTLLNSSGNTSPCSPSSLTPDGMTPRSVESPPDSPSGVCDMKHIVTSDNTTTDILDISERLSGSSKTGRSSCNQKANENVRTTTSCSQVNLSESSTVSHDTGWQSTSDFRSYPENVADELGFDPWNESNKGLADLIEKENCGLIAATSNGLLPQHSSCHDSLLPRYMSGCQKSVHSSLALTQCNNGFYQATIPSSVGPCDSYHGDSTHIIPNRTDMFSLQKQQEWQDRFRALLPNVRVSFSASEQPSAKLYANHQVPLHDRDVCLTKFQSAPVHPQHRVTDEPWLFTGQSRVPQQIEFYRQLQLHRQLQQQRVTEGLP